MARKGAFNVVAVTAVMVGVGFTSILLRPLWQSFLQAFGQLAGTNSSLYFLFDTIFNYIPLFCLLGLLIYIIASSVSNDAYE